jgi:hypothetical protein
MESRQITEERQVNLSVKKEFDDHFLIAVSGNEGSNGL